MKKIIFALKTINYRLWIAILATFLFPSIYQTIRIFVLGEMPSEDGINIASQLSWVELFYEMLQEALILPLFFLLGKSLNNKWELANKVRTGLLMTGIIYLVISIIIISSAEPLVVLMAQENALIDKTVVYVRIESAAMLFATLLQFMSLVLITIKKDKYLYAILATQMLLSIIFDVFLVSNLEISLKLGVNGIAISNIIVNLTIVIVAVAILHKEHLPIFARYWNFRWLIEWFKIGKFSGIESLIRNLVFMIMIIRMINTVAEQGNYWVANNFIWQWLLLPGLALADLIRKDVAENKTNIERKTFGNILLISIFSVLWMISIPVWKPFLQYVMNVNEFEVVFEVVLIQSGFYIIFLFSSCVFDSAFYGTGKTHYILIRSICVNVFYYGTMFILYMTNVFQPALISISIMFGIGITLDFIPTMLLYLWMLKKENFKICFNTAELINIVNNESKPKLNSSSNPSQQ